jgi:outer membrane protein OmpA-like peptidoglycan-associated protein
MCRSPDRQRSVRAGGTGAVLVAAIALGAGPAAAQVATPAPPPPAGAVGRVLDITAEVLSLDGTQSEVRRDDTVTLALTSDVLFATDKATLSAEARERLRKAADQIKAESAGGTINVYGHTDDRASDAYNQRLSNQRAEAVRSALAALLGGQGGTIEARGFGESRPKVPNIVDGTPSVANRAKNRRVEIVYNVES